MQLFFDLRATVVPLLLCLSCVTPRPSPSLIRAREELAQLAAKELEGPPYCGTGLEEGYRVRGFVHSYGEVALDACIETLSGCDADRVGAVYESLAWECLDRFQSPKRTRFLQKRLQQSCDLHRQLEAARRLLLEGHDREDTMEFLFDQLREESSVEGRREALSVIRYGVDSKSLRDLKEALDRETDARALRFLAGLIRSAEVYPDCGLIEQWKMETTIRCRYLCSGDDYYINRSADGSCPATIKSPR